MFDLEKAEKALEGPMQYPDLRAMLTAAIAEIKMHRERVAVAADTCDHGKREDEECPNCDYDRMSDGETDGARL